MRKYKFVTPDLILWGFALIILLCSPETLSPTKRKAQPGWVRPFTHTLIISGVGQILLE